MVRRRPEPDPSSWWERYGHRVAAGRDRSGTRHFGGNVHGTGSAAADGGGDPAADTTTATAVEDDGTTGTAAGGAGAHEELTGDTILRVRADEPTFGWRRALLRASGGTINPGPGPEELRRRDVMHRIRRPLVQSHRIAVTSIKGGVGKTTVSTNIAVGLALREPGSTVIVDLDIQFGDVATALDLEPAHFLGDVTRGAARYDAVVMKTFLTQHRTGLYAICAPKSPAEADAITAEDVAHLLEMLRAEFRYVVLDTSPGMADPTLAALDATTDLVLLTSMDVPGVRGLRKELDTLTTLDVRPETRHLVLNLVDPKCLLSLSDVEATLRTRVDLTLPRTRGTVHSVNQGKPLLESGTRDPMAKQLAVLVDRLSVTNIASKRQPFWRRGKKEAAA